MLVSVVAVKKPLEVVNAELVRILELAVVVGIGLHSVVGQVHKAICEVFEVERLGTGAQVHITVHVASEDAVVGGEHGEGANVELSAVNEKRFVDVELDDSSPVVI